MQPSEADRPETSLDLGAPAEPENPVGTELNLPPSVPPPAPPPLAEEPTRTPGPLGDLVIAHFRRVEIAMLGRVLVTTLSGALPPSMVRVEHRRSFGKRLTGRTGEPIGVTVTAGEKVLSFRAPEVGVTEATVGHIVRGVVLSTTPVPIAQWLGELGVLLEQYTGNDEASRLALERALLGSAQ